MSDETDNNPSSPPPPKPDENPAGRIPSIVQNPSGVLHDPNLGRITREEIVDSATSYGITKAAEFTAHKYVLHPLAAHAYSGIPGLRQLQEVTGAATVHEFKRNLIRQGIEAIGNRTPGAISTVLHVSQPTMARVLAPRIVPGIGTGVEYIMTDAELHKKTISLARLYEHGDNGLLAYFKAKGITIASGHATLAQIDEYATAKNPELKAKLEALNTSRLGKIASGAAGLWGIPAQITFEYSLGLDVVPTPEEIIKELRPGHVTAAQVANYYNYLMESVEGRTSASSATAPTPSLEDCQAVADAINSGKIKPDQLFTALNFLKEVNLQEHPWNIHPHTPNIQSSLSPEGFGPAGPTLKQNTTTGQNFAELEAQLKRERLMMIQQHTFYSDGKGGYVTKDGSNITLKKEDITDLSGLPKEEAERRVQNNRDGVLFYDGKLWFPRPQNTQDGVTQSTTNVSPENLGSFSPGGGRSAAKGPNLSNCHGPN